MTIISIMVPEIWSVKKKKKAPRDINIVHMCNKNIDHMMNSSWDMVRNRGTDRQIDKQMDGRREKVTYRGGCPT